MEDMEALRELAQQGVVVQDAVNLSGLVHAWSDAVARLRAALDPCAGTDRINCHPISQLWADKLASLAGLGGGRRDERVLQAFAVCELLAAGAGDGSSPIGRRTRSA